MLAGIVSIQRRASVRPTAVRAGSRLTSKVLARAALPAYIRADPRSSRQTVRAVERVTGDGRVGEQRGRVVVVRALCRQQAPEERPVALKGDAEVFRGYVLAAVPLCFQLLSLPRKVFGELLHEGGDEPVSLLHRPTGVVDELSLDLFPAPAEGGRQLGGEKRLPAIGSGR